MPQMPPPDSDPEEVKRWWHSLTPGQQDRVKQWFPNTLRNRDGIPIAVRNELNLQCCNENSPGCRTAG